MADKPFSHQQKGTAHPSFIMESMNPSSGHGLAEADEHALKQLSATLYIGKYISSTFSYVILMYAQTSAGSETVCCNLPIFLNQSNSDALIRNSRTPCWAASFLHLSNIRTSKNGLKMNSTSLLDAIGFRILRIRNDCLTSRQYVKNS